MSMTTGHNAADSAILSVILPGEYVAALDAACGATLSSRAAFTRRALVSALRDEGYLPPLPTGPRPVARTRPEGSR